MQAVTMGDIASEYSQKLFKEDKYSDYLLFHGLTVQLAEALAEYVHALIRIECGFRTCLLYTSPSPRDGLLSRMPSSA